ncbi:hypothetical protein [Bordetella genomosp. 9]|uniref:hypothetical protein n=1 Tax=Bordetella genomosp. 9 TaxID=1416803 RepID=UPI0018DFD242|nr:hypothetical protein [Bordetella genomosp. 9]
MAFAAGYWAVHSLHSRVIGYFACDMVYRAGQTHFYGAGTADPLRHDVSLRSLEAKATRLFCWGLKHGKILLNCSGDNETRLVFPRVSLSALRNFKPKSHAWSLLLERAEKIWDFEKEAPFDALKEDYWTLVGSATEEEFIAEVDRRWLSLAPLIGDCAA